MKRDYLKNLDIGGGAHLSDELVEQIMAEDGKAKADLQSTINTLTAERDGLATQLSDANAAIQSYKDMDIDGIKQVTADWETKYNTDTQAFKDQLEGVKYGYAVDKQFAASMAGAVAQGIPVGIYHFSYALNAAGAKAEAEYVLKLLEPYKDSKGWWYADSTTTYYRDRWAKIKNKWYCFRDEQNKS